MRDEGDTTVRWCCKMCGEIIESDYATLPAEILAHKCPKEKRPDLAGDI